MRNADSAVFGRRFLFVVSVIVLVLILVFSSGCDKGNSDDASGENDFTVTFVLNNNQSDVT